MLDLGEIAVIFAAKPDQEPVIGKFQDGFHHILGAGRGVSALMPKWASFLQEP